MFGIQKRVMFGGAVAALLIVSCIANEIPKPHSIASGEAGSDKENGIRVSATHVDVLMRLVLPPTRYTY